MFAEAFELAGEGERPPTGASRSDPDARSCEVAGCSCCCTLPLSAVRKLVEAEVVIIVGTASISGPDSHLGVEVEGGIAGEFPT